MWTPYVAMVVPEPPAMSAQTVLRERVLRLRESPYRRTVENVLVDAQRLRMRAAGRDKAGSVQDAANDTGRAERLESVCAMAVNWLETRQ